MSYLQGKVNGFTNKKINNPSSAFRPGSNNSIDSSFDIMNIEDYRKDSPSLKISVIRKASRFNDIRKVKLVQNSNLENELDCQNTKLCSPKSNDSNLDTIYSATNRRNSGFSQSKELLERESEQQDSVQKIVLRKKQDREKVCQNIRKQLDNTYNQSTRRKTEQSLEKLAEFEKREEISDQQIEANQKQARQKKRKQESEEIFKKILLHREEFQLKWKDINTVAQSCKDQAAVSKVWERHATKLKDLDQEMDSYSKNFQHGDLVDADIKCAETLVMSMDKILEIFRNDIDQLNTAFNEEMARRESEAQKAALLAQEAQLRQTLIEKHIQSQKLEAEAMPQVTAPFVQFAVQDLDNNMLSSKIGSVENEHFASQQTKSQDSDIKESNVQDKINYPDLESLKLYLGRGEFLENYVHRFQDIDQAPTLKNFKFQCQKAINVQINTISKLVGSQLNEKYQFLKSLLLGKSDPNIAVHPQGDVFCKNWIASKLLEQGEKTVTIKPESAFPFAAIIVALWKDFPDFGELFLAQLNAKSPVFAPVYFQRTEDQTEDVFYKLYGFNCSMDGSIDDLEKFVKRLSGLMYLYAAVIVTKQKKGVTMPHPHGIGYGWRWLAATLNIEPSCETANICATLICNFLEVVGNDLWKTYPKQFPKLLLLLKTSYFVKLKSLNVKGSGSLSRLESLLNNAILKGSIPPHKGQLPADYW